MDDGPNVHIVGNGNDQNGVDSDKQIYSMPGILHYLQTEWAKFEIERAQWDVEKAELQARIAFLQGERKGQENLRQDLVRRIKMLEFALKQERAKYHRLKYGTDPHPDTKNMNDLKSEVEQLDELLPEITPASNSTWKQGRQLLRQYLQEVGYTETIIDVRSARVRTLLGLQPLEMVNGDLSQRAGSKPGNKKNLSITQSALLDSEESVMETLNFLQQSTVIDDDDFSDEGDEGAVDDKAAVRGGEADTEEALAEFDFLVSETGDGADEGKQPGDEWGVDKQVIKRLKEQYKKERGKQQQSGKKGSAGSPGGPNRGALQEMLHDFNRDTTGALDDVPTDDGLQTTGEVDEHAAPPYGHAAKRAQSDAPGGDDKLNLGELASLSVSNDPDVTTYEQMSASGAESDGGGALRKLWSPKYTLRSHFDCVRAAEFHPVEPVLITASEDDTLKLWNLQKTVQAKKNTTLDVEPVYTFRGHIGPVLSLVVSATGEQCFSAGVDSTIKCWNIPNSNLDPYDSYDTSVLQATLSGHTDAVWGLALHSSKMHLLSSSSDGTVRLWNPAASKQPLLNTYKPDIDCGIPTCIDFVRYELNQMVASYANNRAFVFDLETGKAVLSLGSDADFASGGQTNRIISHPTVPLTITAHDDKHIRFYDHSTGKLVHQMVAHLDAVTSLAIDPNGLYLLSSSHDCSIRLWNLDSKTCVQEITAHRKKCDESIHDVAFHPSKPYLATAGADGLAKVFV